MRLVDIEDEHKLFKTFLAANGKSDNQLQMTVDEFRRFLRKVNRWNLRYPANKVEKIGCLTTLAPTTNQVTTYLVGLDAAGTVLIPGGGVGESTPHFR